MLAHYLATADLRETTRAKYETLGRLYLTEGFGARPIRSIGKADVREHLAALRDAGKGSATVESVARLLHRLLEVAVEEDRIGRNPAQGVHVAPAARREPRSSRRRRSPPSLPRFPIGTARSSGRSRSPGCGSARPPRSA